MKSTLFVMGLLLLCSCQESMRSPSLNQSLVSNASLKEKLLQTNWRDSRWESHLCFEDECQKYYLVLAFTSSSMVHRLYDKVTNQKIPNKDKVYGISNFDNDSFNLNSDGSFGTYSIKGNQLEICIEGEGCYQFSQHL